MRAFALVKSSPPNLVTNPHLRPGEGTLGGFIKFGDQSIYAITAAHVIESNTERTWDVHDPSALDVFWLLNDIYDFAFIRVPNDFDGPYYNFCFCDTDPEVGYNGYPNYFVNEARSFYENPFINLVNLIPGTEVIKVGHTTGFTRGRLVDPLSSFVTEITRNQQNVRIRFEDMVVIQWDPSEAFTRPGDSGSIYYAVVGAIRYPIAIHSFSCRIKKLTHAGEVIQNYSVGTPLIDAIEFAKQILNKEGGEWKLKQAQ